jgi:hypothetical protein
MLAQDRIRPLQGVAITVVDGETDETAGAGSLRQPPVHFVETDQVDAGAPQVADHVLRESRRHLEQPVRLKPVEPRRTLVMERKNGPAAGDEWTQKMVGGAEIERLEAAEMMVFLRPLKALIPFAILGNIPTLY